LVETAGERTAVPAAAEGLSWHRGRYPCCRNLRRYLFCPLCAKKIPMSRFIWSTGTETRRKDYIQP